MNKLLKILSYVYVGAIIGIHAYFSGKLSGMEKCIKSFEKGRKTVNCLYSGYKTANYEDTKEKCLVSRIEVECKITRGEFTLNPEMKYEDCLNNLSIDDFKSGRANNLINRGRADEFTFIDQKTEIKCYKGKMVCEF